MARLAEKGKSLTADKAMSVFNFVLSLNNVMSMVSARFFKRSLFSYPFWEGGRLNFFAANFCIKLTLSYTPPPPKKKDVN